MNMKRKIPTCVPDEDSLLQWRKRKCAAEGEERRVAGYVPNYVALLDGCVRKRFLGLSPIFHASGVCLLPSSVLWWGVCRIKVSTQNSFYFSLLYWQHFINIQIRLFLVGTMTLYLQVLLSYFGYWRTLVTCIALYFKIWATLVLKWQYYEMRGSLIWNNWTLIFKDAN